MYVHAINRSAGYLLGTVAVSAPLSLLSFEASLSNRLFEPPRPALAELPFTCSTSIQQFSVGENNFDNSCTRIRYTPYII